MVQCKYCRSERKRKYGMTQTGIQRYRCHDCGHTYTLTKPKFSEEVKAMAVSMYNNNVGFRKIARFVDADHVSVQNWVKAAHAKLAKETRCVLDTPTPILDIIELDEIYTFVKKTKPRVSMDCILTSETSGDSVCNRNRKGIGSGNGQEDI